METRRATAVEGSLELLRRVLGTGAENLLSYCRPKSIYLLERQSSALECSTKIIST